MTDTPNASTDLTVAEAVALLGVRPFKIYYYLSLGRIPGAREVDGEWRISRELLLRAHAQGLLR